MMNKWLHRLFGTTPWEKRWQDELSIALKEAQSELPINMVVIVARESDLYAEILFILSFLGLSLASAAAYLLRGSAMEITDLLALPLMGFSLGATAYAFRRYFISKIAPKAIRDRVAQRAKAQFFDHWQHLKGHLALVFFSELEQEALFFSSPEITSHIPGVEVQAALSELLRNYSPQNPMPSLRLCLTKLGGILKMSLVSIERGRQSGREPQAIFIGASDSAAPKLRVPILKGTKDIN